jgi:putative membrane protein
MVMDLSDRDRARLSAAMRASEARTSGEIVCVLARTSSVGTTALPVVIAAVLALAAPWLLMALTAWSVQLILSIQLLVFLAASAIVCLPVVQTALMPRAVRRALAHRAATEQFVIRGIARTKQRTGILIFVSLAEHYARIIADDGIAARVPKAQWQGAVDSLVAHMREGRVADGFIAAIEICGEVLATHFPSGGGGDDELPDRLYLI